LITFPDRVASAAEGRPAGRLARMFTWVLGVRHLIQAALTAVAPRLLTPFRGAAIDGLHAATTVLLATVSPRHRRAALMNAASAATLCALGIACAGGQRERPAATVKPATAQDTPAVTTRPLVARQETSPMRQQHTQPQSEYHGSQDADRFSLGLGDDSNLESAKLIAGVLSVIALVAMLVTSLFRAPSLAPTVVLAVLTVGLSVAISIRVAHRRTEARR
jgi:hypothetical protein